MDRRVFLGTLTGSVLAVPLIVDAQQAGKVWRLGYTAIGPRSGSDAAFEALLQRLRDLGYVEGQNLVIVEVIE